MFEPQTVDDLRDHYRHVLSRMSRDIEAKSIGVNLTHRQIAEKERRQMEEEARRAEEADRTARLERARERVERINRERWKARGGKMVLDVVAVCSDAFGVRVEDCLGSKRNHQIVRARQSAMWLCLHLYPHATMSSVSKRMKRDHTTCLHAVRVVQRIVDRFEMDFGMDVEAWAKALANVQAVTKNKGTRR